MGKANMRRAHFELIAQTIYGLTFLSQEQRDLVARDFADVLSSTNDNFDRDRFVSATVAPKM
jgi:hypothetical protein